MRDFGSVGRQRRVTEVFDEPGLRPDMLRTAHLKIHTEKKVRVVDQQPIKNEKKCPNKRVPFYVHKAECTASVLETQSCLDGQNQKIINQTKANLLMLLYYIIWVVSLWLCQCPIGCNFIVTGFILHTYICTTFGGGGASMFFTPTRALEKDSCNVFPL